MMRIRTAGKPSKIVILDREKGSIHRQGTIGAGLRHALSLPTAKRISRPALHPLLSNSPAIAGPSEENMAVRVALLYENIGSRFDPSLA